MQTMMLGATRRQIALAPATQVALYNVFTAAGNPADPVDVTVTIGGAVVLQAGMTTGAGWASGSTLKLVNSGTIAGPGGGRNGSTGDAGGANVGSLTPGQDGQPGGDAIALSYDLTIDNTSGNIFAGGGQGGGGGACADTNPPGSNPGAGGGGGGGGRGYNNATPGNGGGSVSGGGAASSGSNGSAGSSAAGGAHGNGAVIAISRVGGDGGDGGGWGQPGGGGSAGNAPGGVNQSGGNGGAAGFAVRLNGKNVTWQAGFNGTQVKGGVA